MKACKKKKTKKTPLILKLTLKLDREIRAGNITWLWTKQKKRKARQHKQNLDPVLPRQFSGHPTRNPTTRNSEIKI